MSKLLVFAPLVAALLVCFACTHEREAPACANPAAVSFKQDILPLLNQHCSLSGCHSGPAPSGNLNLEAPVAYAQLTKAGKGYIDTVTPPYSVLYASMNSTADPMPPDGKLEKCDLELVLDWIKQNAPNN